MANFENLTPNVNRAKHEVVTISGFCSEKDNNIEEWEHLISNYPNLSVFSYNWKSGFLIWYDQLIEPVLASLVWAFTLQGYIVPITILQLLLKGQEINDYFLMIKKNAIPTFIALIG